MNLSQLLDTDERGVSPVIGVILMVAITVILAAVIGTFVLGLGDQVQETAPTAQFSTDYSQNDPGDEADELRITFSTGDSIDASQVHIVGVDADDAGGGDQFDFDKEWNAFNSEDVDRVEAGSSIVVDREETLQPDADDLDLSEASVRVVWRGAEDRTSTLATWEGPDA